MSADLIARLIEAGTPAALVAEVAMTLARAQADQDALEARKASEREKTQRYRARGGDQIPGWMRREVFERDNFRCVDCGSEERLECDHVIPLVASGPTSLENLQTLCKPCNARKRDRIRKSDKRGITRTHPEFTGEKGTSEDDADIPPALDKRNPQTPKKINPTPCVGGARAREGSVRVSAFPTPSGVDDALWRDFVSQRKKRLTETAYTRVIAKLGKLAEAGWPPGEMIGLAIERGWETVYEPKDRSNGQRNHTGDQPASRFTNPMAAAAARSLARGSAEHGSGVD